MKKIFFKKTLIFFISLAVATLVFLFLSYNFFSKNYEEIEQKENKKHLITFFTLLNQQYDKEINQKFDVNKIKKLSSTIFDFTYITTESELKSSNIIRNVLFNNNYSNIEVYSKNTEDYLINYIKFLREDDSSLFILKTKSYRALVKEGGNTLNIFSGIVILFLILILLITYTFEKNIEKANENLEEKVLKRTKQIHHTLHELEKVNLKLYDLAHTDHLTQIKNRRSFFMHAKQLYTNASKSKDSLAVIMIDIDNFKSYNDKYGHDIGDKILKEFSKTIKNAISDSCVFGRLGGEEFAIVIPSIDIQMALLKAEKLRAEIENLVIKVAEQEVKVTASFGISDIENSSSIDDMIRNADKMLYSAKESGKNRVRGRV